MSAVRAIASADSWSLSTGFKQYFSCCFKKTEPSGNTKVSPDATSKSDEDVKDATDGGAKLLHRRLEADGASVHSASTDKGNSSSGGAGDRIGDEMTSSREAGALATLDLIGYVHRWSSSQLAVSVEFPARSCHLFSH